MFLKRISIALKLNFTTFWHIRDLMKKILINNIF